MENSHGPDEQRRLFACPLMLTECDAACASLSPPYVEDDWLHGEMNSAQNKDDLVRSLERRAYKPIAVDSLIWLRKRLLQLETEMRWEDRLSLFEEFFPNNAMVGRT